ncbi:hypothetical protein AKJ16_DCAP00562 [Drosera capensis]
MGLRSNGSRRRTAISTVNRPLLSHSGNPKFDYAVAVEDPPKRLRQLSSASFRYICKRHEYVKELVTWISRRQTFTVPSADPVKTIPPVVATTELTASSCAVARFDGALEYVLQGWERTRPLVHAGVLRRDLPYPDLTILMTREDLLTRDNNRLDKPTCRFEPGELLQVFPDPDILAIRPSVQQVAPGGQRVDVTLLSDE